MCDRAPARRWVALDAGGPGARLALLAPMMRLLAAALSLAAIGCFDGPVDETCMLTDDRAHRVNPATLVCEDFTGVDACAWPPQVPTWGLCVSPCAGLTEATCLATPQCRGAYDHDCFFSGTCETAYLGCYATDLNQDFVTGCAGLDAWSCSRHEQCVGTYRLAPACSDGLDQDGDGAIDEADECVRAYARCMDEPVLAPP